MAMAQRRPVPEPENELRKLNSVEIHDQVRDFPLWGLRGHSMMREYRFAGFREAMDFVNRVAQLAEAADHHPDMLISYDRVRIELSTHKVNGLSSRDFELAARIEGIARH